MPLKTKSGRTIKRGITITLDAANTAKFREFEKRIGKIKDMQAFVTSVTNQAVDSFFGSPELVEQSFADFVGFKLSGN